MRHATNQYKLVFWKDGDMFVGQLVEVPAVISQGETFEELQANIIDAYELVMEELKQAVPSVHLRRRVQSKRIEVPVLA